MEPSTKTANIAPESLTCEVESTTNNDDHSDCSVGCVSMTSMTHETVSDHPLFSQLASMLSTKQQEISVAFAGMVSNMATLINEKETENERLLGHDPTESQARRQEQVDKCTRAVAAMAKKQARLARQFEKIVMQLEEQNREKDMERMKLKKQVADMKNRMSKMKISSERNLFSPTSRRHMPISGPGLPRPPLSPHSEFVKSKSSRELGAHQHHASNDETTEHSEAFSIKEISFMSTIVDVEEIMSKMNEESISNFSESAGDNVRLIL